MARRRVLVCGSRDWRDAQTIRERLSRSDVLQAIVIQGGAKGADLIAKNVCRDKRVHSAQVDPLWGKLGKRAGYLRNLAMLDLEPDLVIAFTKGTPGTQITIDEARRRGIPVEVHGTEWVGEEG
jgi:YspA, cpYpsA-related SLOG family